MPTTIGEQIPVAQANGYILEFIANYFNTGDFPVKSFIFDAQLLRNYLNSNPNIENMKFMLGSRTVSATAGAEGSAATTSSNLTMVIVGYDAEGNYIKISTPSGDMVLDHCAQCPPMCPTIGNAQRDTII